MFQFQNTTYQFCALPFGLSVALRTFTKCMAPIVAYLQLKGITVFPYIDNWLIVARSHHNAIEATKITTDTLQRLGLKINLEKSHLEPSQVVNHIGVELNLVARAFLPLQRITKI